MMSILLLTLLSKLHRQPLIRRMSLLPDSGWQFNFDHNVRSEEHTSELQSLTNLVCRLLLEKKKHPTAQRAPEKGVRRPARYPAPSHQRATHVTRPHPRPFHPHALPLISTCTAAAHSTPASA